MSFYNARETGRPVAIKDEGITLTPSVSSIDFTGSGVSGSTVGNDVTEAVSGGGGFTRINPTGSVNGSNTAFVFSQKPTYIVSDGAWYVENTGWTWDGGSSTATMTIPPNDTIYGFV